MFRIIIPAIVVCLSTASAFASTVDISTDGVAPWTVSVPSLSVSNATPHTGYLTGSISPFSGGGEDCASTPCSFDGFWTASLSFTLPSDATGIDLVFSGLEADDRAVLELNGVIIGNAYDGSGATAQSGSMTFTDGGTNTSYSFGGSTAEAGNVTSGFNLGGSNTLELIVNNTQTGPGGSPSGIGFTAAGLAGSVSFTESGGPVGTAPEPASWILLTACLPVFAAVKMRQWRKHHQS